jgi:predicted dehydrogenase
MKNVNIAILGSGFVADFYLQGLSNVNGQQVVVNYSRSKERGAAFAKKWSIPETTGNLDAVVARNDIDLYIIALPNEIHLPVSLNLSKAKRNQACTKPLARNGREARAMFDAAKKSGAIHGYAETEVFAPAIVKARQASQANSAK